MEKNTSEITDTENPKIIKKLRCVNLKEIEPKINDSKNSNIFFNHFNQKNEKISFCCISDTHGRHEELEIPKCDILIISGKFYLEK